MRFRRGLPLVFTALLVAGCATVSPPTPPPTVVEQEAASYRSPADAPRILESLDQQLAAREIHPSTLSTPDLTLYSSLLLTAGRLAEAEKAYEALDARTPADPAILWTLTLLAGARGDLATQEKRLTAFEQTSPGEPEAAEIRARILLAKGDRRGAKAAWSSVLARTEEPEALIGLARLALEEKNFREARVWVDRAVKAAPGDDQTRSLRARILIAQQLYGEARQELDQAVSLAPDNPWHRLDRGKLTLLQLHDFEAARGDLEYASIRDPGNLFVWEALAETYEELDRPRDAWQAWLKVLALRPDYRFAYPSAAMLAFRYQDWERAALYAREAAKAHPAEYGFPFVEALSLKALGRNQAAQTVLEKAKPRFTRGSTVDEMFRFLLTPGSDYNLNDALNREPQETVRLRLRFYQGCFYALAKARASARAAFEEVQESTLKKIPEITAARDWLDYGF